MAKKQHYVWKKYLKAWADDTEKNIWAKIINKDAISQVGLTSVAQESFFYKIEKLSEDEMEYCRRFGQRFSPFIRYYSEELLKFYQAGSAGVKSTDGKTYLSNQFFEDIHSGIEELGLPLVDCKSIDDLKGLHFRVLDDSISFLCTQYFRTRKMRTALVNGTKSSPWESALFDKAYPYFSMLFASQMSINLIPQAKYIFVKNNTDVPFITTDQPVINLLKDELDEDGHVKDLKFYYPISPTSAIMISLESNMEMFSEQEVDRDEVARLNAKMKQQAHNFIFANNESVINAD